MVTPPGLAVRGDLLIEAQDRAALKAANAPASAQDAIGERDTKMFGSVLASASVKDASHSIRREIPELGDFAEPVTSPEFWDILRTDPADCLKPLTLTVLVLNVSLDCQVVAKINLPATEAALKAAGNTRYTIREIPSANHLFQTAMTGAIGEYQQLEETLAPATLALIANWLDGLR